VRQRLRCAEPFAPDNASRRLMPAELTATVFQRRLRELLKGAASQRECVACVQCTNCTGLQRCTFCRDSTNLLRCHYCVACSMCSDCTHCRRSHHLTSCQHCDACDGCSGCAYLVHSTRLAGCSYCFGCVDLSGCDFHILNQPYQRTDYFDLVRRLSAELSVE
jgi:hypothetical protein